MEKGWCCEFMQIELKTASNEEKSVVANLSQYYLYELSKYMSGIQAGDAGLYHGLPDLDAYWEEPNRYAFIIRVDEELAGFVLVVQGSLEDERNEIGEFFVMQKFNGKGVGTTVAKQVFDSFPGKILNKAAWFGKGRCLPSRTTLTYERLFEHLMKGGGVAWAVITPKTACEALPRTLLCHSSVLSVAQPGVKNVCGRSRWKNHIQQQENHQTTRCRHEPH